MLGSFYATASHTVDYVLRNWKNIAAIRFRSKLYLLMQRKTLRRVVAKEKPCKEVEERSRYLSTGRLVTDIRWLRGKGILVAPSITFEWRHKAALNKVGPGDSSNSGDSASISIDAAVSLKLSKVFSALAHFSTIGPGETLLLKPYSNTFRCCGRWKVKALPKCWMSLVLSKHVRHLTRRKKIREIRNNYHQTQW